MSTCYCKMYKERNYVLDIAKIVASFCVICIHSTFKGKELVYPLLRIAVPFFFSVSGFLYETVEKNQAKYCLAQIKKYIWYIVFCSVLYFVLNMQFMGWKEDWINIFKWIISPKIILNMLLFNYSPFWEPLWFLSAMLYVWIIEWMFCKLKIYRSYFCIPILLLACLILGKYSFMIAQSHENVLFTRNFLFTGLPFFEVGRYIRKLEKNNFLTKIPIICHAVCLVFFLVLSFLERFILSSISDDKGGDIYCSTIFLTIIILALIIRFSALNVPKGIIRVVNELGTAGTLWIYIIHGMVIMICRQLNITVGRYNTGVNPFIVFALSVAISVAIQNIVSMIKSIFLTH